MQGPNSEQVFEFLLNQGADPSIGGNLCQPITPLECLVWLGRQDPDRSMLPSMRVLLSRSEVVYDSPEETINGLLSRFYGTAAEFEFLQSECCPSYHEMPPFTRVSVAARIASGACDAPHMPELVRVALGEEPLSIDNLQLECMDKNDVQSTTLVHSIARRVGRSLAYLQPFRHHNLRTMQMQKASRKEKPLGSNAPTNKHQPAQMLRYESWNAIFCDLLRAGIDIHKVVERSTPLHSFLSAYFAWDSFRLRSVEHCDAVLKIWLGDLQISGLDLKSFGQIEEGLFRSGFVDKRFNCYWDRERDHVQLISFTYGSSPDDWKLWMSETSDGFVGDFWDLVERQGDVMPGAWPTDVPYQLAD